MLLRVVSPTIKSAFASEVMHTLNCNFLVNGNKNLLYLNVVTTSSFSVRSYSIANDIANANANENAQRSTVQNSLANVKTCVKPPDTVIHVET
uniref:Uncharacterized protein n=1 Tax=Anguilla anguilla TaxID=7936 RepID=A0A0E9SVE5_ANGAN